LFFNHFKTVDQRHLAKAAQNDPMHTAYTARAATDLSHMTERLTDTANIGKHSEYLMHSTQPNNVGNSNVVSVLLTTELNRESNAEQKLSTSFFVIQAT